MEHFHEQTFDFLSWRCGNLISNLKILHNTEVIKPNKAIVRKHAVGYCKADNLPCRPKPGYIAVMFIDSGFDMWWTHLLKEEFIYCFPEIKI